MSSINTNIPSIRAFHRLDANQQDLETRLERLSTGLRINTGKDDPAGLIASETLRSEIRGIGQALENSSRAISVLSTSEGALNEVSALLLELRGLITNTANEGALSAEEIQANQLQIDSLLESINRIANGTQFAGRKLLDGSQAYLTSSIITSDISQALVFGARVPEGASLGVSVEVTNSAERGQLTFNATGPGGTLSTNVSFQLRGNLGTEILSFQSGTAVATIASTINSFSTLTGVTANASGNSVTLESAQFGSSQFVAIKAINGDFVASEGTETQDFGEDVDALINGQVASADGKKVSLRSNGLDLQLDLTDNFATTLGTSTFSVTGGGALFQIGPNVNSTGQISIGTPSVSTANLGTNDLGFLNSIGSGGSNRLVSKNFATAEQIVVEAINQVAVVRGRLGGLQKNQIETNINSQQIALENVTAAESAIRDADVAEEVSSLTRAQILVQSGSIVLSLANQIPQQSLALLGG